MKPHTTALAQLLDKEKSLLHRFLETLAQEHQVLLSGKIQELPVLAAAKTELAAALEDLEAQRRQRCAEIPALNECRASWREIRELGGKAARANIENGVVLAALMRHVEGALRLFTGAEEPFYGPAGGHTKATGSRPLASA